MRAISLWQPWATAIALGAKRIETRSWSTSYRGPLAIHAAQRWNREEMRDVQYSIEWIGALGLAEAEDFDLKDILPRGAIVAVCDLVGCVPTRELDRNALNAERGSGAYTWSERDMGDFTPGRFGWLLDNILPLKVPVPFKGAQGLFEVPDQLVVF